MVWGILTLLLGVLSFIMYSQPVFAIYGNATLAELGDLFGLSKKNCYNNISFNDNQNTYLTVGNVFLILSMVSCGIMILLTLLNLIARATNNKSYVGTKIASISFFVFTSIASIMMIVYTAKDNQISSVIENIKDGSPVMSIGYGLIIVLIASFFAMIFSPRKKK